MGFLFFFFTVSINTGFILFMYHVHVMTSVEHTSVIRQISLQKITKTLEVEKDMDRSVGTSIKEVSFHLCDLCRITQKLPNGFLPNLE